MNKGFELARLLAYVTVNQELLLSSNVLPSGIASCGRMRQPGWGSPMPNAPLELQGKLLRVIQEGQFERVGEERTRTVNVRLVSATNCDLANEAAEGTFRLDLYCRLGVFPIEIPPWRERVEDIVPWLRSFREQQRRI